MNQPNLVMVGGAVCVLPATCHVPGCGQPAETFEGIRTADPSHNRVEGSCGECAGVRAAQAAWFAGLDQAERSRYENLIRDHCITAGRYHTVRQDRHIYGRDTVRRAQVDRDRAGEAVAAFEQTHGRPIHPRGLTS